MDGGWRCVLILISAAVGFPRSRLPERAWPNASSRPISPGKAALLSTMTLGRHRRSCADGDGAWNLRGRLPPLPFGDLASREVLDKAHNDYLEILLGLGIPAGTAIILGIVSLVFRCFRGVFLRQRNSYMPMAAVLVGILVGSTPSSISVCRSRPLP